jgi:hypothetical protein
MRQHSYNFTFYQEKVLGCFHVKICAVRGYKFRNVSTSFDDALRKTATFTRCNNEIKRKAGNTPVSVCISNCFKTSSNFKLLQHQWDSWLLRRSANRSKATFDSIDRNLFRSNRVTYWWMDWNFLMKINLDTKMHINAQWQFKLTNNVFQVMYEAFTYAIAVMA